MGELIKVSYNYFFVELNDSNGNKLPTHNYEAKKILYPMGMVYKMIHACSNDYILDKK